MSTPPPGAEPQTEPAPDPAKRPARKRWLTNYVGLPEPGWGTGTVGLGLLVAIAAVFIGTIVVVAFDPELETNAGRSVAQLVVALGLIGTALVFATSVGGGRLGEGLWRLGLARITGLAVGAAVLAWFAYVFLAGLLSPLLQPEQEDVTRELGTDESSVLGLVAAGFLIIVAASLSEEIFFRGFVYAGLRRSIPLLPAALISAVVWAALHLGGGNLGVVAQLAVFGMILAWLYERTGTLWAPILAHAINNSIAFTLLVTDVI